MKHLPFMLLLGIFPVGNTGFAADNWALFTQTAKIDSSAQSIGSYTSGCLSGAVSLPQDGLGYQLMRLSRNRSYGHPELIRFIEDLAKSTYHDHQEVLLIGDLGQIRGGPTPSGHRSHQTGLDVDIWFLLSAEAKSRSLKFTERETLSAPSVLLTNSDSIDTTLWTTVNEKILETAAKSPEVERIFVNPSIKRLLCTRQSNHEWLRKIRPWWKHDDHFHVRLKCPVNNKNCVDQESLPDNDGCDASLAWWFSEDAKKPVAAKKPKPLILPTLCDAVFNSKN